MIDFLKKLKLSKIFGWDYMVFKNPIIEDEFIITNEYLYPN